MNALIFDAEAALKTIAGVRSDIQKLRDLIATDGDEDGSLYDWVHRLQVHLDGLILACHADNARDERMPATS